MPTVFTDSVDGQKQLFPLDLSNGDDIDMLSLFSSPENDALSDPSDSPYGGTFHNPDSAEDLMFLFPQPASGTHVPDTLGRDQPLSPKLTPRSIQEVKTEPCFSSTQLNIDGALPVSFASVSEQGDKHNFLSSLTSLQTSTDLRFSLITESDDCLRSDQHPSAKRWEHELLSCENEKTTKGDMTASREKSLFSKSMKEEGIKPTHSAPPYRKAPLPCSGREESFQPAHLCTINDNTKIYNYRLRPRLEVGQLNTPRNSTDNQRSERLSKAMQSEPSSPSLIKKDPISAGMNSAGSKKRKRKENSLEEPSHERNSSHDIKPDKSSKKSNGVSTSTSATRRQRTVPQVRALARSQAPEAALTREEIQEIARMHESDEDLALSRELYIELARFKAFLRRHGYSLCALTVDPIIESSSLDQELPFDFVLKRKPQWRAARHFIKEPVSSSSARSQRSVSSSDSENNGSGYRNSSLTASVTQRTDENVHDREDTTARKRLKLPLSPDFSPESSSLNCTVCVKAMSDFDTLFRHFRHAHQELKPFCCPRCKGSYSSESTLWHHIRNVHSEKPRKFRCSQCDASYDSFGAKTRHEHATHSTDTPEFACSFPGCTRAFNFPAHLEHHANSAHPGFRPFGCIECTKRFQSANGLIRHRREVHRRQRAYSCSCGTTFAKKDHLKRHLLQRHSMSYEKATEEMRKQPSPGLVHVMPPAAPAAAI